ncbi:MAG: exodeoxyribonuclease VII small subunit [Paludibacteraceae bacterium]|nr:exodeoxyribonuclease VII small subunit [Paludibacteraceae bacterium]
MEKEDSMTYDEAIARIEQIVNELEQSEALSMDAYQAKAREAKELLDFCQKQLTDWSERMECIVTPKE